MVRESFQVDENPAKPVQTKQTEPITEIWFTLAKVILSDKGQLVVFIAQSIKKNILHFSPILILRVIWKLCYGESSAQQNVILRYRHRCKVCVCVYVCSVDWGGCDGSEWHRWHEAPAAPRASDRHVAHSQPRIAYAKRGVGRERVLLTTTWAHRSQSHIVIARLSVCLFSNHRIHREWSNCHHIRTHTHMYIHTTIYSTCIFVRTFLGLSHSN